MNKFQKMAKRSFDVVMATFGLLITGWLIVICWIVATVDTRENGIFSQERVGMNNRKFSILKIRTMRPMEGVTTTVTRRDDPRVTAIGSRLRRWKLDELPQLLNVFVGDMSFVGPRPDTMEFANLLQGDDRDILSIRPGITGPATLAFIDEEELLTQCKNPESYNRNIIFPVKVRINSDYIQNYSFSKDMLYLAATVLPPVRKRVVTPMRYIPDA